VHESRDGREPAVAALAAIGRLEKRGSVAFISKVSEFKGGGQRWGAVGGQSNFKLLVRAMSKRTKIKELELPECTRAKRGSKKKEEGKGSGGGGGAGPGENAIDQARRPKGPNDACHYSRGKNVPCHRKRNLGTEEKCRNLPGPRTESMRSSRL